MRISDWSSDVCSSDLPLEEVGHRHAEDPRKLIELAGADAVGPALVLLNLLERQSQGIRQLLLRVAQEHPAKAHTSSNMNVYGMGLSGLSDGLVSKHPFFLVNTDFMTPPQRSEEHTSELQSLMRNSYSVFCLK